MWLDLSVREWHLFLVLVMVRLMSEVRLPRRLACGLGVLWEVQLDCQLLVVVGHLDSGLMLGSYKNQNLNPHSLCTHSFNIIGGLSFLLLKRGC